MDCQPRVTTDKQLARVISPTVATEARKETEFSWTEDFMVVMVFF